MIYWRAADRGVGQAAPRSRATLRFCSTAPLALYPLGCVAVLLVGDRQGFNWIELAAFAPILISVLCFAVIVPSYLSRIMSDVTKTLDELEIDLRRRAHAFAHRAFAGLAILLAIYMHLALDAQEKLAWLWTPTTADHWGAVVWGALLYALLLPVAYLAWTMPPEPEAEARGEA